MAEWAAMPSCTYLQSHRGCFKPSYFMPPNGCVRTEERKHYGGKFRAVLYPLHEICRLSVTVSTGWKDRHLKKVFFRCQCLGTLVNPENMTPSSWVPVVDQVLLLATVAFAFMAGVIPSEKAYFNSKKKSPDQVAHTTDSTSPGSALKSENQTNLYAWDEVRGKLLDALDVIENNGNLVSQAVEFEKNSTKNPLSLYAIAEGPRIRLLLATLQQLQEEVNNISGMYEELNRDKWLVVSSETIRGSVQPVSLKWLEEEFCPQNKNLDKALLTRMFERLKGDDTILQSIKKLGKEDLYADLLFFLRFGCHRSSCHYDSKLLTHHGVDILEDLVITLADGITSMYLELISVDSNMSSEMSRLDLVLCSLSTRALQRLRNEVALNQWLHQNIESVVSMYEDRFDMFALQTKLIEGLKEKETDRLSWWKKITLQKPTASSPLCYIFIRQMSLPVKRTKELRALSGWRYYFSLFLELSDITMPLVRAVVAKVSRAVSFFLVCLIGRSLGLIYTGIRQALGWK